MAWYDSGSVSVTNGSTTVTGTGTDFISGAQVGEAFLAPDDKLYEIQSITSATVLVLADPYLGSTQSGQEYKIVPTQSLVADLASQVTDLITDYSDVKDTAGAGKFNDGTVTAPAITFEQDQNNGLYRIGNDNWGLVAGGDKQLEIKTTGVKLDDNKKITFGAGDDLQIYHDGNNSYIGDFGTGNLNIRGANLQLQDPDGYNYITAVDNGTGGEIILYHNNSGKLATTSTGVDVTGTVTADAVSVTQTGSTTALRAEKSQTGQIIVAYNGASVNYLDADTQYFRKGDGTKLGEFSGGDFHLYEDTGTTAKFVWDSSAESLGIGTSSPSSGISGSSAVVEVAHSNLASVVLNNTSADSWEIASSVGSDLLFNNGTTRAVIDSSGNVGIGTGSPSAKLTSSGVSGTTLIQALGSDSNGNADVEIKSTGTSGSSRLFFADTAGQSGALKYAHSSNSMSFITNGSEAMRLDSSRNLLVGTTTSLPYASSTETGVSILANGTITNSTSATSAIFNTLNDGNITQFRKDGSPVGSIGTNGGDFYFAGSGGSLRITTSNQLLPSTTSGTASDNTHTLGSSSARFKDLYLSGGVYLGGTGSANKLDDYEEGTWTPVTGAGNISGTSITYSGKYTKVGRLVVVYFKAYTATGDISVASYQLFSGLPFTADSMTGTGTVITEDIDQFDRQGFASVGGTSFAISNCGSSSGTTSIEATVTYYTT